MVIRQGEIFWIDLPTSTGSAPGYNHPHVIVQNNVFNNSRIRTTVVCALTSNLERAKIPGNVLLNPNEGNLTKQSVVTVSQILTIDKQNLGEYIGSLSAKRVDEILEGIDLILQPRDII